MADAMDLLENIEALDLPSICSSVLQNNEEVIADLNATQLSHGLRSDGTKITPEYAELTVMLKEGKSGLAGITDRVTLFDTGDYYGGLYAEVQGQELTQGSTDEKADKLEKKYATQKGRLTALNVDSADELATGFLSPQFKANIEDSTGLKFE
jgi:hypothetical protein